MGDYTSHERSSSNCIRYWLVCWWQSINSKPWSKCLCLEKEQLKMVKNACKSWCKTINISMQMGSKLQKVRPGSMPYIIDCWILQYWGSLLDRTHQRQDSECSYSFSRFSSELQLDRSWFCWRLSENSQQQFQKPNWQVYNSVKSWQLSIHRAFLKNHKLWWSPVLHRKHPPQHENMDQSCELRKQWKKPPCIDTF